MPELEVIAMTLADALAAVAGEATSIEVIQDLSAGGLTPDIDLVRQIADSVHTDIHVIVRPHAEGFVYSPSDKQTMLKTVQTLFTLPITSVVIGGMTVTGELDFDLLKAVQNEIEAERITVHRVIDHVTDPFAALQTLSLSIGRVLCSGAPTNAYDGRDIMQQWVAKLGSQIHFKCGGGITFENIAVIHQVVNAPMYHTGSAVRTNDKIDADKVRRLLALLNEV